jgi:hypothetical protein
MRRLIFAALLLPLALPAAEDAASILKDQQKVYDGIMSDHDLYAGEGLVSLSSYGGDLTQAKTSAKTRARAALAETISVRIKSTVTDTMNKDGDKVEAKAESVSDLELQDVQYKVLEGFPKEGQLTVLASLSKEDWLRQNDKRLLSFRPLRALRLWGGMIENFSLSALPKDPPAGPIINASNGSSGGGVTSFGADFYWTSWVFGLGTSSVHRNPYIWQPRSAAYEQIDHPAAIVHAKLGYEWTPWATRFQAVLPLQLEYNYLDWDPYFSQSFGVASGLRLRYWSSDRVAFDFGCLWHQGLGQSEFIGRGGDSMVLDPSGKLAYFSANAPELSAGVVWNGF